MFVFYYFILKPNTPRERVLAPEIYCDNESFMRDGPFIEAAVEQWQLMPARSDAEAYLAHRLQAGRIRAGVPHPLLFEGGGASLLIGLDDLRKNRPLRPINQALADFIAEARREEASPAYPPPTDDTLLDLADDRTLVELEEWREKRLASLKRIEATAPPCDREGLAFVYQDDPSEPSVHAAGGGAIRDPWRFGLASHAPTFWLLQHLARRRVLGCLEDLLINGRSWRASGELADPGLLLANLFR